MDVWKVHVLHVIVFYNEIFEAVNQNSTWSLWSECSKTCGIGRRSRDRYNETGHLEQEEQYCNVNYCPDTWKECSEDIHCSFTNSKGVCVDGRCRCTPGDNYNEYNCLPEIGGCIIREDPPTALGYLDPSISYDFSYMLYSCTENNNPELEVHIIGIRDEIQWGKIKVTVLPRGPVNKPIILVLVSYNAIHWVINTTVDIQQVLYGGESYLNSTVTSSSPTECVFNATLRSDLPYGHGRDMSDGNTTYLIQLIEAEYGPITSFTGYYELSGISMSSIILKVGGDPMAIHPQEYVYDISLVNCILVGSPEPATTTVKYSSEPSPTTTTTSYESSTKDNYVSIWESWSGCSKMCDIGTKTRNRRDRSGSIIETQKRYCNLHYCTFPLNKCEPGQTICNLAGHPGPSDGRCVNGFCLCKHGYGYNVYHCYPTIGTCYIRPNPPVAIGYKDPSFLHTLYYNLNSCTTDENPVYDVHIVGIYGHSIHNSYTIDVIPRGAVTKPIILVLTSYLTTHWIVNSNIGFYSVLYNSQKGRSTVDKSPSARCGFTPLERPDLSWGYGEDIGEGHTKDILNTIYSLYGSIASFTGYRQLVGEPSAHIILDVGGDPLAVLPDNYKYNSENLSCNPVLPKADVTVPPYPTAPTTQRTTTAVYIVPPVTDKAPSSDGGTVVASVVPVVVIVLFIGLIGLLVFCWIVRKRKKNTSHRISQRRHQAEAESIVIQPIGQDANSHVPQSIPGTYSSRNEIYMPPTDDSENYSNDLPTYEQVISDYKIQPIR